MNFQDNFAYHIKDEYIRYYNYDRIKLKLKGMSLMKYRTHFHFTA